MQAARLGAAGAVLTSAWSGYISAMDHADDVSPLPPQLGPRANMKMTILPKRALLPSLIQSITAPIIDPSEASGFSRFSREPIDVADRFTTFFSFLA